MTTFPSRRLALAERAPSPYAAMLALEASVELDGGLRELIRLRASQINGCALCLDMHWQHAQAAGQDEHHGKILAPAIDSHGVEHRGAPSSRPSEAPPAIAAEEEPVPAPIATGEAPLGRLAAQTRVAPACAIAQRSRVLVVPDERARISRAARHARPAGARQDDPVVYGVSHTAAMCGHGGLESGANSALHKRVGASA